MHQLQMICQEFDGELQWWVVLSCMIVSSLKIETDQISWGGAERPGVD